MRFLKKLSIVVIALFICVLLLSYASNIEDDSSIADSTSRSNSKTSATSHPSLSTPLSDDPVDWARYAAQNHMPKGMTLDTVEISQSVGEKYLVIACNMETMWDGDDYITAAADLICGVIPVIRDKDDFDHVTFLFYGPFIDKYGNSTQQLGIRSMYSRDTLNKVNVEFFARYTHANPSGVIEAADTYMIHPSYKK